jgi:peptidoglycan/xylan/chitin deacetylase (PgdA/CDA1 family)
MKRIVGLRIDVDTLRGFEKGVAPLIELLRHFNIKATFFIVTGYDNPLRAIPRIITERGFVRRLLTLQSSFRYKSLSLMTRLPFRESIRMIQDNGHEIGLHGNHHFIWQQQMKNWSTDRIQMDMSRAGENFRLHMDFCPLSFAAPGWVTTSEFFLAEEAFHFEYCSDTRGIAPFYPRIGKKVLRTLQIPVTLQTLDELITLGRPHQLSAIDVRDGDVYCAHAEFDGLKHLNTFKGFIERNLKKGFRFVPLKEIKRIATKVPACPILQKVVSGRTQMVSYQGLEKRTLRE